MQKRPILKEIAPTAGNSVIMHTNNVGQTATGTVFIMNRGINNDKVSVALVTNGNVITSNCFICSNATIHYGHSIYLQQLAIGSQDYIEVYTENGTSTFVFTGQTTG